MTVDWQQAEVLFHQLLETPEAGEAVLASAAVAQPALVAAVRELQVAHEDSQGPLSSPVPLPRVAMSVIDPEDRSFHPYRLLRKLGQGGMGAVYLAERIDARFEKQVAIKILAPLRDHPALVRRFARERTLLAKLEHPNLCRLLDAGEMSDGTPYVVLEYVAGENLLEHCDSRRLSLTTRLDLFRQICSAVHHAHQNLVVHRDIKPGNIMVDAEGRPKLMDFGLAKLLAEAGGETQLSAESQTLLALTPEYASPEQWSGEAVSTASDVYSLGILLVELLLGFRPFDRAGASWADFARRLRGASMPAPSVRLRRLRTVAASDRRLQLRIATVSRARRLSPRALERRLRGDLDHIVLRACRTTPKERYASAAQLSEDVRRTQLHLPITAQPASSLYRLSKLVRRHKAVATLVLIVGLLAVALLVSLTSQVRHSDATRDRAVALAGLLIDGVQHSDPLGRDPRDVTASAFLLRAREMVELELVDDPVIQLGLLNRIGVAYQNLGEYDQAIELHRRALATCRSLSIQPHEALATTLEELSTALRLRGDFRVALPLARESLTMHRELFGERHQATAKSLENLAEVFHELGHFDAAEPLYLRALAIRRETGDAIPLAATLDYLGLFRRNTGDSEAALAAYSEARDLRRATLPPGHVLHARSAYNQASLHLERNELAPAEGLYRSALVAYRQALGEKHPRIALCLNDLGLVTSLAGRFSEAEDFYRQALVLRSELLEETHIDIAQSLLNLGSLLVQTGRPVEAGRILDRCLALCRASLRPDHPYIGLALLGQAEIAAQAADPQRADSLAKRGIELLSRTFGHDHWRVAEARASQAGYLLALGRPQVAELHAQRAVRTLEETFGPRDARTRRAKRQLLAIRDAAAAPAPASDPAPVPVPVPVPALVSTG